jgi:hypothetical protein
MQLIQINERSDMEAPKEERTQVLLRLPVELKEHLKQRAIENQRSLTGEIVVRLMDSMEQEKKQPF